MPRWMSVICPPATPSSWPRRVAPLPWTSPATIRSTSTAMSPRSAPIAVAPPPCRPRAAAPRRWPPTPRGRSRGPIPRTPGGAAARVAPHHEVRRVGTNTAQVESTGAPQLTAWDRWNYQRTDYMIQPASAQYVANGVYGAEELDRHGSWRTVDTYGSVWVPGGVPAGWVPYSTGRWIWDPRFGWTWLDTAPWGWAPYHYGRWVFVSNYWAWAPGPGVVRPASAPARVVFLGGVTVSFGRPVCWAPLAWGEPLVPWWGRPGF